MQYFIYSRPVGILYILGDLPLLILFLLKFTSGWKLKWWVLPLVLGLWPQGLPQVSIFLAPS